MLAMNEEYVTMSGIQRKLGWGWPRTAKAVDGLISLGYMKKDEINTTRFKLATSKDEAKVLIPVECEGNLELSKDELLAITLLYLTKEVKLDNVQLQVVYGWKCARAMNVINSLGKTKYFEVVDEDTIKLCVDRSIVKDIINRSEIK